jgi:hypothetical protein
MQIPEIAVIEKPADHVRWDLACALRIKLVPGRELKPSISTRQRSHKASMEKAVGLDYDHAGSAMVRITVGQPEERRRFGLLQSADRPPALWSSGKQGPGPHGARSQFYPTRPANARPKRRRSGDGKPVPQSRLA